MAAYVGIDTLVCCVLAGILDGFWSGKIAVPNARAGATAKCSARRCGRSGRCGGSVP